LGACTGHFYGLQDERDWLAQWFGGNIYQRRTKNGIGRHKKTVPHGTAKTQRVETMFVVSAIDEEVRFFFIFLICNCNKSNYECKETNFFLFAIKFCL
jgi:hypothetical protein